MTAVANGDLSQKFVLEAQGEVAALAETINNMTDYAAHLRRSGDVSVAREVGIEGKLGGQAKVPGAAGTWRDLTDNVNQLGQTTSPPQVRAIAEVSTAVAAGRPHAHDQRWRRRARWRPSRTTSTSMIGNLKDTTAQEPGAGLAEDQPGALLQHDAGPAQHGVGGPAHDERADAAGRRPARRLLPDGLDHQGRTTALQLDRELRLRRPQEASPAAYRLEGEPDRPVRLREEAHPAHRTCPRTFIYHRLRHGRGAARSVVVLPVLFEGETKAVIELASFKAFVPNYLNFLDQLMDSLGRRSST